MIEEKNKSWQCPNWLTASGEDVMNWQREVCFEDGQTWLKGQSGYNDITTNISLLKGNAPLSQERSDLKSNYLKYIMRKIVSYLADTKEIASYGSDAPQFKGQAETINLISKAIYLESMYHRKVRRSIQWAIPTGVGYIWPKWKREKYGFGRPQFCFETYGMLDVVPFMVPSSNEITEAYANTIVEFLTVVEAHGRFPSHQASLVPISDTKYNSTVSGRRLDLAEMFRYGMQKSNWPDHYCEIHYTFVRDITINTTGKRIPMGDIGSSWYYEVPSLGDLIPDGKGGTRKAGIEDCLLFPRLRLIISSPGMTRPIYDGTAFDWHGLMPAVPYQVDDWPWEGTGLSLVSEIRKIDMAKQRVERGMDQIAKHRLDPALAYDLNAGLSNTSMEKLDPFEERVRTGVNGKPREVIDTLLPEALLNVPEWIFKYYELLVKLEESQTGINDIGKLANLKMNIQGDDAEKMLSEIGPLAKDIEFGIEASNAQVGERLRYMIPQYMTTKRIMQYLGPDQVSLNTFDFDPESLVPSHTIEEIVAANGNELPVSNTSRIDRARLFCDNLRLTSIRGSGHEATSMQDQLKYLQLWRDPRFPMSPYDLAKKLKIENFGDIEGNTMYERWVNWKKKEIELQASIMKLAAAEMPQMPAGEGGEAGGKPGHKATGNNKGRRPTAQRPPHLEQKGTAGGAPRTVVSESR